MGVQSKENTWFAIVNPHAGSGKTMAQWQKAEKKLRLNGVRYECAKTEYGRHAVLIASQAAGAGFRRFVAVGGDGTAHEVFNGLMQFSDSNGVNPSEFTLAVIPIGSGNDWIKTHKIPHDTEEVVRLMVEGKTKCQDIVRVQRLDPEDLSAEALRTDYMLNIGGIGFDARVCEIVNAQKEMGKRGKLLYVNALLKVLANFYSFPARVFADGEEVFSGECYSMAFGVGLYSGGGMRQVPLAVVDDGLLDMTIIPRMPIMKLLPKLPRLFNGTLCQVPELVCRKARKIEVLPAGGMANPAEIDGEVIGVFPLRMEIIEGGINVLSNL